jgi:fructose-1,6-bisphosphatase I / sedoheptulose-1,7-bisphosphatase
VAADRKTLGQFLDEVQFTEASSAAKLRTLLFDLSSACKTIGQRVSDEPLRTRYSRGGWMAHLHSGMRGGRGMNACSLRRGPYLAVLLPVDSPSNIAVNASGGTIFSILQAEGEEPGAGCSQVCSGYAIHGPSLVLVLALLTGVQAFVLDRTTDEFVLTDADIRVPAATDEIAIDASNTRFWQPAVRRYVDECQAGEAGPRGRNFRFHWLGSMVAEAHRILMRGGVFVWPATDGAADRARQPRLLHEANPLAFLIEKAGGRASTGMGRILDVAPSVLRLRTPLIFGAAEEVDRIEAYHGDHETGRSDAPLFATRGLFRSTV